VDDRPLGPYDTRTGMWRSSNRMEVEFQRCLDCDLLNSDEHQAAPGDVVIFLTGWASAHCGWFVDGWLYHALSSCGVVKTQWRLWSHRASTLVRIRSVGYRSEPMAKRF
jgi:uncharacterized protein YfaT (DUF1175 family)